MSIATAVDRLDNPSGNGEPHTDPAETLQVEFAACALHCAPWWGTTKSLTPDQKRRAAEVFGADVKRFRGGKALIDTSHPAYSALTKLKNRALEYWRDNSLPWPDKGIRLIRQDQQPEIRQTLDRYVDRLEGLVVDFNCHRSEILRKAETDLQELFDPADYPSTWEGEFGMSTEFPNVTAPEYLRRLDPEAYERERARVAARFTEAVELAEQAFTEELAGMVGHLVERLTGRDENGQPKSFRASSVDNLVAFFDRFRSLSVRSNAELDRLVDAAQEAVKGVNPRHLRDYPSFRANVADSLQRVGTSLDAMMENRPRRAIIRRPRPDSD